MPETGIFITFEGGEGAGKTTQIERLSSRLRAAGKVVLSLREPGGTPLSEAIRDLIKAPKAAPFSPKAELLLFIAARAELVASVITPALEAGKIVLCDRFLDSTIVYQSIARGLDRSLIDSLNQFVVGKYRPNLTFFFDLAAQEGLARARKRGEIVDSLEAEPLSFHEKVREGYQQLTQEEPNRWVTIDATAPVNTIEEQIWKALEDKIYA